MDILAAKIGANMAISELTESGQIPNIQTAEVGQAIVVKAVDENGKPTEWEAASVGGGGGGLPVVKLTTVAGTNYAYLSDEETSLLDEVDCLGLPVIFQVPVTFVHPISTWVTEVSIVLPRLVEEGYGTYYAQSMINDSYLLEVLITRVSIAPGMEWRLDAVATHVNN